jgi:choline kinase
LNSKNFPTLEEQKRFIRSYVEHPYVPVHSQPASPMLIPNRAKSSSSIAAFNLDNYASASQVTTLDRERDELTQKDTDRLIEEARFWRPANSAQWVAWGIVQAKIPGLPEVNSQGESQAGKGLIDPESTPGQSPGSLTPQNHGGSIEELAGSDPLDEAGRNLVSDAHDRRPERNGTPGGSIADDVVDEPEDENDDEFDYLAYTHDRAMFFLGDLVSLGLLQKEELPEEVQTALKLLKDY